MDSLFKKKFVKNKKGSIIFDVLSVLITLFGFAIVSVVVFSIWQDLSPDIRTDIGDNSYVNQTLNVIDDNYVGLFDGGFLFIILGLWLTVLVGAFFLDSHPIFFVVSFLLLIIVLVLAVFLGNAFEEIMLDFPTASSSFVITNWIMNNILMVVLVMGLSVMIVLYGKSGVNQ